MVFPKRSHALVIGGSIAGLCAARVLSRHFDRVTLIERDRLPEAPEHRPGVPQSHHIHALLLRGLRELERLFPGIENDLTAKGAFRCDLGNDFAHCTEWGWARRAPSGVRPLMLSRLLIESVVRARALHDITNLTRIEDARATGLITQTEGDRILVLGVKTSRADARELHADLVVDASGRNSKCLEWLEAAGVARPPEELVDSVAGYSSRFYQLAPDPNRWWRGMLVDAKITSHPCWGLFLPVEGGRHVLTVGGVNGNYPPGDESGHEAFLKTLTTPAIAHEIARATPVSDIRCYRELYNRARRFNRWQRDVGGFVAVGDSAMVFNPYHGQGMSMAAASANALDSVFASARKDDVYSFSRRYYQLQAKVTESAWSLATSIDLEWPSTLGQRPFGYPLFLKFGNSVLRATHEYPELKPFIHRIYQLSAEPSSLWSPRLLGKVAYAELRRRLGGSERLLDRSDLSFVAPTGERADAAVAAE